MDENLRTILEAADMAVQDELPDDATIEVTAVELMALAAAYRAAAQKLRELTGDPTTGVPAEETALREEIAAHAAAGEERQREIAAVKLAGLIMGRTLPRRDDH